MLSGLARALVDDVGQGISHSIQDRAKARQPNGDGTASGGSMPGVIEA